MIRLCLADDHPVLLAGLQSFLEESRDLQVVGLATSGREALLRLGSCAPDVAVVDISMPGISGIELVRQSRAAGFATRIIVFSAFEDRDHVGQAMAAGARGYVLKRSAVDHLALAIRAVHRGELYVDPAVAANLYANPLGASTQTLTRREDDVLRAVAFGYSIKEVAVQPGITTKSVETYKLRACEKLKLASRAGIVRYAVNRGWFAEDIELASLAPAVMEAPRLSSSRP